MFEKDEEAVLRRFGIRNEGSGILYTRTERRFFDERAIEAALIAQLQSALEASGFWHEFHTDWVCLDCELMLWSLKAQELLQRQYATEGAVGQASLDAAVQALQTAGQNGQPVEDLLGRYHERADNIARYVDAYRAYCWPVHSLKDIRLAPFNILATEGTIHT